jgi:hypothetical protein
MNRQHQAFIALAVIAVGLMAMFHSWGYGPLYVLLVAAGAVLVIVFVPRWIIRLGEGAHQGLQTQTWKAEEGRHHAFAGVRFTVEDDGRHVWMLGDALKRVLARPEADDVLAARISGKWRLDAKGRLWLRVDAVVEHLSQFPGRMDPRVQKLRRWLERDVLFPAGRRHAGAGGAPGPGR